MRIITAIGNPKLKIELEKRKYMVPNKDIQYKEGILEYLEEKEADCLIIYEKLEGSIPIKNLMLQIKKQIKNIILILEKEELIYFLKREKINYIKSEDVGEIENLLSLLQIKRNIKTYKVWDKRKAYKKIKHQKINCKKINSTNKKYKMIKKLKWIEIINLYQIQNKKIEKFIKEKSVIKICIKRIEEKFQFKIDKRNSILKEKDEIQKYLCYLNLKYYKKRIIFFIEQEEILQKINKGKKNYEIIWVMENKIESIKKSKKQMLPYTRMTKVPMKILCITDNWRGIDFKIIQNIFPQISIVNKIKIGEKENGIRNEK